jgi:uncharacterized cupredoxin-like copper-binding protein
LAGIEILDAVKRLGDPTVFKQVVLEDQVKMLGETDELQPNATKSIELTLAPGNYLLVCNVPGHYAAGMTLPFTVAP